jgi:hemolysin activation/secretion protein
MRSNDRVRAGRRKSIALSILLGGASCVSLVALAQTAPDAGRTSRELAPRIAPPAPSSAPRIEGLPAPAPTAPGGPAVALKAVSISGNTIFDDATLQGVVGDVDGKGFDLAGLRAIADRVAAHYRANGYSFARALIPAQRMEGGILRIEVVEGRYAPHNLVSEDPRGRDGRVFLETLKPGTVIHSASLERATLLLDDQPGFKAVPLIRPGQEFGTGELNVLVTPTQSFGGEVSVDNHGNRYTGRHRARVDLYANSPLMFGDRFKISTLYTDENLWFGDASYSLPVGGDGLRASIGYSNSYYQLGKEFANLDSTGTVRTASFGLSYPFVRSQVFNLNLSTTFQHKWINDRQQAASSDDSKTSDSVPVSLAFDFRDGVGGGALTYGALAWTPGWLHLDHGLRATDRASVDTEGQFNRFNLDVARIQALPEDFQLFGKLSAQWADKNLDSSESFGLGGANGVRGYPAGEGYGDVGALGQLELRYKLDLFTPYGFYDAGVVKTDRKPRTTAENQRTLSSAGLGLRFDWEALSIDASAAWRLQGGDPQSDIRDQVPVGWVSVRYRF